MKIHHAICCSALLTVLGAPAALAGQDTGARSDIGTGTSTTGMGAGTQSGMTGMGSEQGIKTDDLEDKKVVSSTGDEIGEVEKIVRGKQDDKLQAVVEVGGFLGMGEKEVTMPLSELKMQNDQLVAPQTASKDQLKSQAEYDESQYEEVSEDQQIDRSEFAAFESRDTGGEQGQGRNY
jgi:hypothetical protein